MTPQNPLKTYFHTSEWIVSAGGGPSGGSLEHPSSSLESRTTLEEEPQQGAEVEAVLPHLSSEVHQRELSPGSAAR